MKTFLAVTGGLFAAAFLVTGVCVACFAGARVLEFDDKLDQANDRLKVLLDANGITEHVK